MSTGLIEKLYNQRLAKMYNVKNKKALTKQHSQVLILKDMVAFDNTFKKYNIHLNKSDLDAIYKVGVIKARKLGHDYRRKNTRRYNGVVSSLDSMGKASKGQIGNTAFVLENWNKVQIVTRAMLKAAISIDGKIDSPEIRAELRASGGDEDGLRGFAQLDNLVGTKKLYTLMEEAFASSELDLSTSEIDEIRKISTTFNRSITQAGDLRANYASTVTFESDKTASSKELSRMFYKEFAPHILKNLGESDLAKSIQTKIVSDLSSFSGAKKSLEPRLKVPSSASSKSDTAFSFSKDSYKAQKVATANIKLPDTSRVSLKSLLPYINKRIRDRVRANMGSPKLNYQTGVFAGSVAAVNASETAIYYTYQRAPYRVFEFPNGAEGLATPDRDPRKIIGETIREIAAEKMRARFDTIRV